MLLVLDFNETSKGKMNMSNTRMLQTVWKTSWEQYPTNRSCAAKRSALQKKVMLKLLVTFSHEVQLVDSQVLANQQNLTLPIAMAERDRWWEWAKEICVINWLWWCLAYIMNISVRSAAISCVCLRTIFMLKYISIRRQYFINYSFKSLTKNHWLNITQ